MSSPIVTPFSPSASASGTPASVNAPSAPESPSRIHSVAQQILTVVVVPTLSYGLSLLLRHLMGKIGALSASSSEQPPVRGD